jgi:PhnB protein
MGERVTRERAPQRTTSGPAAERPATVMPIITVDSVDDARAFYVDKLGFGHMMGMLGKDGQLDFCTVTLGGARVMLNRPQGEGQGAGQTVGRTTEKRPVEIYLEVGDVKAYHHEVKTRGVKITSPLTTQWWGDRTFTVQDPYGYQLWFFQPGGEMKPPPGAKIV